MVLLPNQFKFNVLSTIFSPIKIILKYNLQYLISKLGILSAICNDIIYGEDNWKINLPPY